jgi:hypothetical protein
MAIEDQRGRLFTTASVPFYGSIYSIFTILMDPVSSLLATFLECRQKGRNERISNLSVQFCISFLLFLQASLKTV